MNGQFHCACNQYAWQSFYRRNDQAWNLAQALAEMARSGLDGYEPLVTSVSQVEETIPLLEKHGLAMRSLYVNSTLHVAEEVAQNIEQILVIAEAAKPADTRIVVTNPSPIRWGSLEAKSDEQLVIQAEALNRLGAALQQLGLTLAYHYHDAELRHAAREFHHMMLGTDPEQVALCLDPHWLYRGAGNSQIALFDVVRLYGQRVVEIHLRQSADGIWAETFGPGDIDYPKLISELQRMDVQPHLVLEQAVEIGTPNTIGPVDAHRHGLRYAQSLFVRS